MVAAAGNEYTDNDQYPLFPASWTTVMPGVISVGATEITTAGVAKTDYSNWGQ